MTSSPVALKPHVVCIPHPVQGHINPMLKLAKLLHSKGFYITFINTEFNHKRLLKSRGPNALSGLPDFQFETIPDGLPPSNLDATQNLPALLQSITKNFLATFRDLLARLNSTHGCPPVTCIVLDGCMSNPVDAIKDFGIPVVLFWTTSLCGFLGIMHFQDLIDRGITPLKDESYLTNGYLDNKIDWIPGLTNVPLRYFPSFIRTTDRNEIILNFLIDQSARALKASAIVLNSFDEFEQNIIPSLSDILPPIYTIGPLHLLLEQTSQAPEMRSILGNLWKEEPECLEWLNSKETKSVVYVNFGSIAVITAQQLVEFAWGLANSKKTFLWIIRPDLVRGEAALLPPVFLEETKGRSMIASWCPQEKVLNHPAVGGFLTHSGWNSTIESVCSGVPMACWPFFADQQTTCWFVCNEWGIGMEINSDVRRNDVENLLRELMEGDKGKQMRKKAEEWKAKAEAAASPGSSSILNLDKLINEILLQ